MTVMQHREHSDRLFKEIGMAVLEDTARVETELEVMTKARRVDLMVEPYKGASKTRCKLGAIGRMSEAKMLMEGFHHPPSSRLVLRCVTKQQLVWDRLELDARPKAGDSRTTPMIALPPLWIISGGVPKKAINGLGFQPMPAWSNGFYQLAPDFRTFLVATPELPKTPDTLALRLMGTGKTRQEAMIELGQQPDVEPWRRLKLRLIDMGEQLGDDPEAPTPEEEDFMAEARKLAHEMEADALRLGAERTWQSASRKLIERRLKRALTADEEARLRHRLEQLGGERVFDEVDALDGAAVLVWLRGNGTSKA